MMEAWLYNACKTKYTVYIACPACMVYKCVCVHRLNNTLLIYQSRRYFNLSVVFYILT